MTDTILYHQYFRHTYYPMRLPPLEDGVEKKRHRVVIVGGGPVGMALAIGLARYHIPSVVLEADNTVSHGSRAACISRRSLEILDQLGCAESILEKALPWTSGTSYYRDQPIYRLEMPMNNQQRFYPMVNIQQCFLEDRMFRHLDQNYQQWIDWRWQTRMQSLSPLPETAKAPNSKQMEGVRLQVQAGEKHRYTIDTDWLIACDGAHSSVRQALGLRMSGHRYQGCYIIVDILLKSNYPTERRAWFDPPTNPGLTILMHRQPDDIWRVDYQLGEGEDPTLAVLPQNVLPRVREHLRWIGERDDWQPVWISSYRASCLSLEQYRHGHCLFAGDAAHLVPIFGVRGLNSGLDDAHNLAWKMAAVIHGTAPIDLLDTYTEERVYAAGENIRHATKSTEFMAPSTPAFVLMREAVLGLAVQDPFFASLLNPRQSSAINYPPSPCFIADTLAWIAGPPPGANILECPLIKPDGTPIYLSELLGAYFTLLWLGAEPPNQWQALLARISLTLGQDTDHPTPKKMGDESIAMRLCWITPQLKPHPEASAHDQSGYLYPLYGAKEKYTAYFLRPDGHVAARWQPPQDTVDAEQIQRVLYTVLAKPYSGSH